MICPYCKKEISNGTVFCPNCGQEISTSQSQSQSDAYWTRVNQEDSKRSSEYKKMVGEAKREANSRRRKKIVTTVLILTAIALAVFGIAKFQQNQSELIAEVKSGLIGKTMTAHSTHMEGLGWIHHEYWQLTFVDEDTLDYAYIQTVGPAEDDEQPKYQGTYSYTISRSIFGEYTIRVNGATYELRVSDDNVPRGISR